ncbi:MAG: methionyl-tRNA formyltransferase [Firmicutes bacterium]|nr:methionyl-tRNA formyltransferase [Bacillota bacterium]
MRIVFMGTPTFAVPCLRVLAEAYEVVAVVTQPDRPSGRGKKLTPSPVKTAAVALGIPVMQPESVRNEDFHQELAALSLDFIITAAYGKILPPFLLAIPTVGALNIHASLLPRHRGAAPIHRAIMAGDKESGITIMHMDKGMDTGDMVVRESIPIEAGDTTGILHDKLAILGAQLITAAIKAITDGNAQRIPQDHNLATYAAPLTRAEEQIGWHHSAQVIDQQVRGMNPWPGAYTYWNQLRLKVWAGKITAACGTPSGAVMAVDGGLLVATGGGAYLITELQLPGKKAMSATDFLRGNAVTAGTVLGKTDLM